MFKPSPFLTHSPFQLSVLLFSFYPIRSHQTETDYTSTSSSNNLVFCWWRRWFGQALKSLVHPEPVELPVNLQPFVLFVMSISFGCPSAETSSPMWVSSIIFFPEYVCSFRWICDFSFHLALWLFVAHLVCFPSLWFEVHPRHAFDVFDILSKRMVYQEQKYPRLFLTLSFPLFFLLADCSSMKLSNSVSIVLNNPGWVLNLSFSLFFKFFFSGRLFKSWHIYFIILVIAACHVFGEIPLKHVLR